MTQAEKAEKRAARQAYYRDWKAANNANPYLAKRARVAWERKMVIDLTTSK